MQEIYPYTLVLGDERYATNNSPNVHFVRQEEVGFIPAPLEGRLLVLEVFCYNFLELYVVYLSIFMTFIVISQNHAIPLPHLKRVCEGLGGCDTT